MGTFIGTIVGFLVIVYVYTFLKIRKQKHKRSNEKSYVETYHEQLDSFRHRSQYTGNQQAAKQINNYVTKYNSTNDYIES